MPKFINNLKVRPHSKKEHMWVLESPLIVHYEGGTITVPKGFETDLASIPRPFWAIYPPMGKYTEAAVVHDYLYRYGNSTILYGKRATRASADRLFRDLMKSEGVGFFTRNLFYYAIRVGGAIYTDLP